ncbi:unnamed protein product [Gongylonema pulchrum]|uniref:Uncharacterized protein n=1 Tax=Gongylonema pulchrum TaxID=637853 RepID=A0A183DSR4_9BILA|nr:unnamed protein product [Gongylonema pulchrum]
MTRRNGAAQIPNHSEKASKVIAPSTGVAPNAEMPSSAAAAAAAATQSNVPAPKPHTSKIAAIKSWLSNLPQKLTRNVRVFVS